MLVRVWVPPAPISSEKESMTAREYGSRLKMDLHVEFYRRPTLLRAFAQARQSLRVSQDCCHWVPAFGGLNWEWDQIPRRARVGLKLLRLLWIRLREWRY